MIVEKETLDVLSVIGTWVSSIGTVGAVVTSLWLASSRNKVKLKVSASFNFLIDGQDTYDVCLVSIINVGTRPVTVNTIGWNAGKGKKAKNFIQMLGNTYTGTTLPKVLEEHQDVQVDIPFKNGDVDWLESMAKDLSEKEIKTLQVVVATNIGETFKAKVNDNLINAILNRKKNMKSKAS